MLHTIQLYYNKKGFSEATTLYTRRGDTGELLSATFKDEIDELLVLPEGSTTFDVSKVYFEAEGNGVFVRREVPAKYLDLTTPKKPRIKNFPMPAEMFAKGPNVVDNCYFRFELKTGAPTLDTESPVTVSSSSFNTIVLGSPIPGIRSYYLDEIDYLIKEFEKAIAGYTPADIEAFYAELKAEIELAKKQAKQDIEDLNALFVQSEADLRAKIVREIADMNKLIQNMQTSLDAQLLELQKQIDATKAQITTLDNKLVQVETDITNAKKEINQVKIDTTAEINQVKEDTAAQITKVKNDASTEINKIKNESISAVTAEKEAVIKMINDLKAEIAAMDLEQLVLDLFAQGKVKDVMVAEIQKEVTKQLTEKGAASQQWVEDNFINLSPLKSIIESKNLFSFYDIVESSTVKQLSASSALFSGWANVFAYNAKLSDYLVKGKEYAISYKFTPTEKTSGTTGAVGHAHGTLALYSGVSGNPLIRLYGESQIDNTGNSFEIGKSEYRSAVFTCPDLSPEKGYNMIGYGARRMSPDGTTFVRTDAGIFSDVMIVPKGSKIDYTIAERDFNNPNALGKFFGPDLQLPIVERFDSMSTVSTDWIYVRQLLNGPNFPGVGTNGYVKRISLDKKSSTTFFKPLDSIRIFIRTIVNGADRGWKELDGGQQIKVTQDNGEPMFSLSDANKDTMEWLKSLPVGTYKVYIRQSKDAPAMYLMGTYHSMIQGAEGSFIATAMATGAQYTFTFATSGSKGWKKITQDGQEHVLTNPDGTSKLTLHDATKTTLELMNTLPLGAKFVTIGETKDVPIAWLTGYVTTNGNGTYKTFIGTSTTGATYQFSTARNEWLRLDGQVQKITLDSGAYKSVSGAALTTLEAFRKLGVGVHFIYTVEKLKDAPDNYLKGIVTVSAATGNEITFIGEQMVGTRGTWAFNGMSNQWKRLDVSPTPEYPKEVPTASIGMYPSDKNTFSRSYVKAVLTSETTLKLFCVVRVFKDATFPNQLSVARFDRASLGGKKLANGYKGRRNESQRDAGNSNWEYDRNVYLNDTGSTLEVQLNIFQIKDSFIPTGSEIYIELDIPLE